MCPGGLTMSRQKCASKCGARSGCRSKKRPRKLAYNGERQVVRKAQEYLKSHPEV